MAIAAAHLDLILRGFGLTANSWTGFQREGGYGLTPRGTAAIRTRSARFQLGSVHSGGKSRSEAKTIGSPKALIYGVLATFLESMRSGISRASMPSAIPAIPPGVAATQKKH